MHSADCSLRFESAAADYTIRTVAAHRFRVSAAPRRTLFSHTEDLRCALTLSEHTFARTLGRGVDSLEVCHRAVHHAEPLPAKSAVDSCTLLRQRYMIGAHVAALYSCYAAGMAWQRIVDGESSLSHR